MGREFLSPLDLFSGYLLPIEEHEGFSLWYGRRKYKMTDGWTHFRGWCCLGTAASEEEVLAAGEQILDEGGDLTETPPPPKKKKKGRKRSK